MTLLYLVAAWTAGIFIASGTASRPEPWLAIALLAALVSYGVRRERRWRLGAICLALVALGGARYAWATHPLPANHIAHFAGSGYATITGVIIQDADVREKHTNLRVRAETLAQHRAVHPVQGLLLVQAPRYGTYAYGDRVRVSGQVLTPPEFDGFSYRDYLARQGIHALIPGAEVEVLAHDQGWPWLSVLHDLKVRVQRVIDRLLPSPQAPLLSGILIGVESGIAPDVREAFNRTGTAHIIAISGANIIILIRVFMGLLKPALGIRRAGWLTIIGIAGYVLLVGADGAVIRAAIMGSLSIVAWQVGRRTYGLTSLAFSIWAMSVWNPHILWDIGFQLSVAATAGLVLLGDPFTNGLRRLLERGFTQTTARQIAAWLAEPLTIGLAAQITTTPLILVHFGRFSVITLVANMLIVPIQPYIMTGGWLAVLAGLLLPPLGELAGWVIWVPLTYTLTIVQRLGALEWASVDLSLSPGQAWSIYGVLLAGAWWSLQHPDDRRALLHTLQHRAVTFTLLLVSVSLTVLVWIAALNQPDGKLHVWFLDIGHGHGVLIETPQGAQILIDGGPNPTRLRTAIGAILPFWDRSLDLLIVTQPKGSAIGALPALLDHYRITQAVTNGQAADTDHYRALWERWERQRVAVLPVTAGYQVTTNDGVVLEVLHPQTPPTAETPPDNASLVLRVRYGQASFLLTSELSAAAEQSIIDAGWYMGSTVLELPDFGSQAANSQSFLEVVRPQLAVVGVEAGNRSILPDRQVVERVTALTGRSPFRTDQHGTIEIVSDGQQLWIYTHP